MTKDRSFKLTNSRLAEFNIIENEYNRNMTLFHLFWPRRELITMSNPFI